MAGIVRGRQESVDSAAARHRVDGAHQREEPMPLPPRDFSKIGPNEGEPFPDVCLPDQTGTTIDLHHARAARKAIVVVHRSAEW